MIWDFRSDFDVLDHKLLFDKLKSDTYHTLYADLTVICLLENNMYFIMVLFQMWKWKLKCGVPQGSYEGPLLFYLHQWSFCSKSSSYLRRWYNILFTSSINWGLSRALDRELQSVVMWAWSKIKKSKAGIVFGSNFRLKHKPQSVHNTFSPQVFQYQCCSIGIDWLSAWLLVGSDCQHFSDRYLFFIYRLLI